MDSIIKFKEAAKELQNDERYLAMVAARKANDENTELQNLIGEFNLARMELNNEMSNDNANEQKVNELNLNVNKLYSRIMADETMVAYNDAKDEIEKFMEYVNAILNAAIAGEDPMEVEEPQPHSCGEGGCSSCSGCH